MQHETLQPHHDRIELDHKALEGKQAVMKTLKAHSMLNSMSMVAGMISGPMLAFGLVDAVKLIGATGTAALTAGGVATVLAVGLAIGAVAVAANYMAQRKGQSGFFDNAEFASKENARYLVKEMEAHNLCVTNRQEPPPPPAPTAKAGRNSSPAANNWRVRAILRAQVGKNTWIPSGNRPGRHPQTKCINTPPCEVSHNPVAAGRNRIISHSPLKNLNHLTLCLAS